MRSAEEKQQSSDILTFEATLDYLEKTDVFDIFKTVLDRVCCGKIQWWYVLRQLVNSLSDDSRVIEFLNEKKQEAETTVAKSQLPDEKYIFAQLYLGLFHILLERRDQAVVHFELIRQHHGIAAAFMGHIKKDTNLLKESTEKFGCTIGWLRYEKFSGYCTITEDDKLDIVKAAELLDPKAMELLAFLYSKNVPPDLPPSPDKIKTQTGYLKKACVYGYLGLNDLAKLHYNEEKDYAAARRFINISHKLGSSVGAANSAIMYRNDKNYAQAIIDFDLAIKRKNDDAKTMRANMYEKNQGTDSESIIKIIDIYWDQLVVNKNVYFSEETRKSFRVHHKALANHVVLKSKQLDVNSLEQSIAPGHAIKKFITEFFDDMIIGPPLPEIRKHLCTLQAQQAIEAAYQSLKNNQPPAAINKSSLKDVFNHVLTRPLNEKLVCLNQICDEKDSAFYQFFSTAKFYETNYIKEAQKIRLACPAPIRNNFMAPPENKPPTFFSSTTYSVSPAPTSAPKGGERESLEDFHLQL